MSNKTRLFINIVFVLWLTQTNSFSLRKDNFNNKEIGGSLLELISQPQKEIIHKDYRTAMLEMRMQNKQIYHKAFPTPETQKMRKWGLVTLIIFGTLYLIIRTGYNYIKNLNRFFAKGVISLSNQILLLFICLSILIVCYVYGAFDSIYVNWEHLIAAIGIFILSWIMYNLIVIILSLAASQKWNDLERQGVSFSYLKSKIKENSNNKNYIASFEFLILKRYFFVPLFPVLKSSSLRKELKFSYYLEQCLLQKLRQFFKISWTSWVGIIICVLFWNVYIVPASVKAMTIFLMLIPLLGLLISLSLYFYIIHVYRKIVKPINDDNINEYQDIEYTSNDIYQSMAYPEYLSKIINEDSEMEKAKNIGLSVHEHLHQRAPSLYEDLLFCGQSGIYFILNILQCCSILLICWCIATFAYFADKITKKFSNLHYWYIIIGFVLFTIAQVYITVICLKWLTMISSIEMKRNDKCVKKMIKNQMKQIGEVSNEIINSFKKIYFDVKKGKGTPGAINNQLLIEEEDSKDSNEFELQIQTMKDMLTVEYNRFDKANGDSIDIKYELRPFLKSCGNILNASEIEFMLSLYPPNTEFDGNLTLWQLFDICGALLLFRMKKPSELISFAFDYYYKENPQMYRENIMKWINIEEFFTFYKDYFNQRQLKYIKEQCDYLGNSFSTDEFIAAISTPSQYYPY